MKKILSFILILSISVSLHAQKVLFLDAGHGGKDLGAVSETGITESQINASFVKELKVAAEAKGIKVIMINAGAEYVSLKDRADKVNNYKLDDGAEAVLISIHMNFSKDQTKSGIEVYRGGDEFIAEQMIKELGGTLIEKRLTLLESVSIPAILINVGYLSNQNDLNNVLTMDVRSLLINKIIKAVEQ